jgi:hypothetical protein
MSGMSKGGTVHRSIIRVTLAALGAAALPLLSAGAASARNPISVLIPTNPHAARPLHGGTVDSLNWSGYAVTSKADNITRVKGSFVVPSAGLLPPGFAATWAGIGGYNTQDLIQAGVAEQSLPSNPLLGPKYNAWYELLPASETPLSGCSGGNGCPVKPGDVVTVKIHRGSGTSWTISMKDAGHWRWTKTVSYKSSRSSAEWILEAPTVGAQTMLAPVGTVHFGPKSTYVSGGRTHTIAQGNPTRIVLSPGVVAEATPSALASDGQSFNDCAYAQTCAAPK